MFYRVNHRVVVCTSICVEAPTEEQAKEDAAVEIERMLKEGNRRFDHRDTVEVVDVEQTDLREEKA